MEFESPDVERDFPGLYAESGKRSNESDFSDETHEKVSKKDLLIGKRKDKKDKKDKGYATLEGESSPEEDIDVKSPSKTKKSKPFKFPSAKKEKREKSRDKDSKEHSDKDKDKKKPDEKEKKKEKVKLKLKDKKKSKHSDDVTEIEDLPVFGVPLTIAIERSKCHDGVDIPLVVRNCIDHVEETGLTAENVYKISGIKSRVQQVKRLYNQREVVSMSDYDLPVATSLLKLFLRDLPEPVLTTDLLPKFEEAVNLKETSSQKVRLKELVQLLPSCNRTLLAWLVKHFNNVIHYEKQNKMGIATLAATLGPPLQTSPKLLSAILQFASDLLPNVNLTKYVPPQTSASLSLPETAEGISSEIQKQESLLCQIHKEMNQGLVSKTKEEQLWEVQRIITLLKRKLRSVERAGGVSSLEVKSSEEVDSSSRAGGSGEEDCTSAVKGGQPTSSSSASPASSRSAISNPTEVNHSSSQPPIGFNVWCNRVAPVPNPADPPSLNSQHQTNLAPNVPTQPVPAPLPLNSQHSQPPFVIPQSLPSAPENDVSAPQPFMSLPHIPPKAIPIEWEIPTGANHIRHPVTAESLEIEDINRPSLMATERKQKEVIETEELVSVVSKLRSLCDQERSHVSMLKDRIRELGADPNCRHYLPDSSDEDSGPPSSFLESDLQENRKFLKNETKRLQNQKEALIKSICAEFDACIDLRIQIKLLQLNKGKAAKYLPEQIMI